MAGKRKMPPPADDAGSVGHAPDPANRRCHARRAWPLATLSHPPPTGPRVSESLPAPAEVEAAVRQLGLAVDAPELHGGLCDRKSGVEGKRVAGRVELGG